MVTKMLVCTQCGFYGKPKTAVKGSGLVEIFLWLCFLVPGIIYSLWRSSSRHGVCPKCQNTNLIPADSPMGKKTLTDMGVNDTQVAEVEKKLKSEMSPMVKAILIGIGVIFLITFLFNLTQG